jgi:NADPH:quinone reductase-like Zn-dependent oxidoreductase
MNAYFLKNLGSGIDGLAREEFADPSPGPGEVLVEIHARSINFRDLLILDVVTQFQAASASYPYRMART